MGLLFYPLVLAYQSLETITHENGEDVQDTTCFYNPNATNSYQFEKDISFNLQHNFTKRKDRAYMLYVTYVEANPNSQDVPKPIVSLKSGGDNYVYGYYDEKLDDTIHKGQLVYECLDSLITQITDNQASLESNFFGRTDNGYSVNGDGHDIIITNGLLLRNATEVNGDKPNLALEFLKLYKSLNYIYGLKLDFKDDKIIIEKRDWTTNNTVELAYNKLSITKWNDKIYNEILVGNTKVEYENINGTNEFNSTLKFSPQINARKNTLDLVSPYNLDYLGVELAKRNGFSSKRNVDTKYDDKVFLISAEKINGVWQTKTVSDKYSTIEGVLFPDTSYNLDFSPKRMMINNSDIINAFMSKRSNEIVSYEVSNNLASLSSQKIGGNLVIEKSDYTPSIAVYMPELIEIESHLSQSEKVFNNKHSLYKISHKNGYLYGFLYSVEESEEKATIKLIRK